MSEKRYVVPEGMLDEVFRFSSDYATAYKCDPSEKQQLEAALRWLSETKQYLSVDDLHEIMVRYRSLPFNETTVNDIVHEALRRMFLAPEPEVPEAIKDLLLPEDGPISGAYFQKETYNTRIMQAYRYGQKG